jgi:hypothetical protein
MARWLNGSLARAALAALALGGCQSGPDSEARVRAQQTAIDPPRLWSASVIGGAAPATVMICADSGVRDGFSRTIADVNGDICLADDVRSTANSYVTHCSAGGRRYAVSLLTEGDRTRDFKATFTLHTLEAPVVSVWQTRRYRQVGACPAGWNIGDQARPGERPKA